MVWLINVALLLFSYQTGAQTQGSLAADDIYAGLSPGLSAEVPKEVSLPRDFDQYDPVVLRPFFDAFSWQSFIALSWPADPDDRGVPLNPDNAAFFLASNTGSGRGTEIVWESYREGFELFPNDNSIPPEWNDRSPSRTPAGVTEQRILGMVTKGGLLDEINEAFGGPLIDQNRNYVRYEVRINEIEYEQVRTEKWYDVDVVNAAISRTVRNQKQAGVRPQEGIQFKPNSIELKGAWRELTDEDDASKFYTVEALIPDEQGNYTAAKMGLVGLHVMQKTERFPQWIWSTFEHIDNVSGTHPSFNNGTPFPPSLEVDGKPQGYDREPAVIGDSLPQKTSDARNPIQVTRALPIPSTPANYSTQDLNLEYRKLLEGTVWENYQLIATQWPRYRDERSPYNPTFNPDLDYVPSVAGDPFPKFVANVSMETYFQTNNSCLQCHYHAAAYGVDYSWIMYDRVLAPSSPTKK